MSDEQHEHDEDCQHVPNWPFNPWSIPWSLSILAAEVAGATANFFGRLVTDMAAANNNRNAIRQAREAEREESRKRRLLADDLRSLELGEDPS